MKILSPDQVRRIYDVTDSLHLHRQWVVVPLARQPEGREMILPDGKLLVSVPEDAAFEVWVAGLPGRLATLNFTRTPRTDFRERAKPTILAESPPGSEGPPFAYNREVKPRR